MISVVIPAFDEQTAIAQTVASIQAALTQAGLDGEIIIVDDGSSDGTGTIAATVGAKVIRNMENLGYGFALKRGIAAATNDTIVIIDADGTYPIERIGDLVERYRQGWDMVVGARQGDAYRESALKAPLRAILKGLVEFTAGRPIPDPNSGFRVFSRDGISPFFPYLSDGFSFTTSSTLAYMLMKKTVCYTEIDYAKRIGTTKVRLLRDSLRTIQYIVSAIVYYNPLKIFLLLALFMLGLGALALVTLPWFGGHALVAATTAAVGAVLAMAHGLRADQTRQISLRDLRR